MVSFLGKYCDSIFWSKLSIIYSDIKPVFSKFRSNMLSVISSSVLFCPVLMQYSTRRCMKTVIVALIELLLGTFHPHITFINFFSLSIIFFLLRKLESPISFSSNFGFRSMAFKRNIIVAVPFKWFHYKM